jgi:hypothetical protein
MLSSSLDGGTAYKAEFRFRWRDHSFRSGEGTGFQSLCHFISLLVEMRQPGQQCFEGHPRVTVGVDSVDWFPEELYCSGFREAPTGLCEEYRISLRDIDGDPSLSQPPFEVVEIRL